MEFNAISESTYRAPLMYQSAGDIESSIPSLGIRKCAISGARPLTANSAQNNVSEGHQDIRLSVMCGHTGVDKFYSRKPITFTSTGELVRSRWYRNKVEKSTGCRSTEHERTAKETHEMVLLWH